MISIPTLSFCITCKNRFHQISRTLPQNLDDNRLHRDFIEFVLVDFESTDGLREWVLTNFRDDLRTGYLRYYHTCGLPHWHASIAKNTAHRLAKNEILVNLDCDNYTGYLGGQFVIGQFLKNRNMVLQQFGGDLMDGSFGRISVLRTYFETVGGYDESFGPMAYQDLDLIERLKISGLVYKNENDSRFCKAITNTKEEGLKYANTSINHGTMNLLNKQISKKNFSNGNMVANNGIYGITVESNDSQDKSFVEPFNQYTDIVEPTTFGLTYSLIDQIARLAGFCSDLGLYHGKAGLAVLLYHASRYLNRPEWATIAATLLDDILCVVNQINRFDFDKGITGIAWGLHHLMINGFVELEEGFFEELDEVLFEEDPFLIMRESQYPILGLYLHVRLQTMSDKTLWQERAATCCRHTSELLKKEYYKADPNVITPFLYCLFQWKNYAFAIEFIENSVPNLIPKNSLDSWLWNKLTDMDIDMSQPDPWTLKAINDLCFEQLIYGNIFPAPDVLLKSVLASILEDTRFLKMLLSTLNYRTVGLSGYVSGLAWSLLRLNYFK